MISGRRWEYSRRSRSAPVYKTNLRWPAMDSLCHHDRVIISGYMLIRDLATVGYVFEDACIYARYHNFPLICAFYQIRKIAGCWESFSRHRLQRKPLVSDPGMHHGACITHVPWCMSGSLPAVAGKTLQEFPAHAQPAIVRIWQEARGPVCLFVSLKTDGISTCNDCVSHNLVVADKRD